MAIIEPNKNDISLRRTDPTHKIDDFMGVNAQVVIDTNDEYRPVIMDGATLGGKAKVALLHSAPFKKHPTVPSVSDISKLVDNHLVSKKETNLLIKNYLEKSGDDSPSLLEQLNNKLDHTTAKDSVDLDEVVEDGIYRITHGSNTPSSLDGICHVYALSNTVVQEFISENSEDATRIFYRRKTELDPQWSKWQEVLASEDLETIAKTDTANTFTENQAFSKDITVTGSIRSEYLTTQLGLKMDHTISKEGVTDLNTLTLDGIYYIADASEIANKPTEAGDANYFIQVYNFDAYVVQCLYDVSGSTFIRTKTNAKTWLAWKNIADVPFATTESAGVVKLATELSDDETTAATPKLVNQVNATAELAKQQAESNENNITALTTKVDDAVSKVDEISKTNFVKTVNSQSPDPNGNVALTLASEKASGIIYLASQEEVNAGSDTKKAVTPATMNNAVGPMVKAAVTEEETVAEIKKQLDIKDATTANKGVVQLSNDISTDEYKAATPKALQTLKSDTVSKTTGGVLTTTELKMPSRTEGDLTTVDATYVVNKGDVVKLIQALGGSGGGGGSGTGGVSIKVVTRVEDVGSDENVIYFVAAQ